MTQVSINRWIDRQILVYLHNEILLNSKKEWTIDACNHMDELQIHCAKWKKPASPQEVLIEYWWFHLNNIRENTD